MRPIPFKAKMETIEHYLEGLSTNGIVAKTGISKGAVISILKDAREGKFPGLELKDRIDELHSLSVRLRKEGLELPESRLGFTFLKRLRDLNVEPDKVEQWIEFCSEISPSPAEGFLPAAMELLQVEKETGKSLIELTTEVKELSNQREKLVSEVEDLQSQEAKAKELKSGIEESEKKVQGLRAQNEKLETNANFLNKLLQKRAEELGISSGELERKLRELVSLENEVTNRAKEKNRLEGEIEALTERQEKLSSQMEKASSDFQEDIKLIRKTRDELAQIAEMKGRYEKEIENMEWAEWVLPFLSDPDKVQDDDFSLIAIVTSCMDKWIQTQPEWRYRYSITWDEVKRHVQSKRMEFE
jgi:hypothetical protein